MIFILILNWNGKENTLECLESVQKLDYPNYQVVVIDNGSVDDSVTAIQQSFPQVEIIENGRNLGYAEGNNKGIERAIAEKAEYIFILNNDAIVDPQILNSFIDASCRYPQAGIFGAKIYYYNEPNRIWFAGGAWQNNVAQFTHLGFDQIDDQTNWNSVRTIDYACGCALFFKAEVVQKNRVTRE